MGRAALAIDRGGCDLIRKTRREPRIPGDVRGLLARLSHAPRHDLVNLARVDARAPDHVDLDRCEELGRMQTREPSVAFADRSAGRLDDDRLRHPCVSLVSRRVRMVRPRHFRAGCPGASCGLTLLRLRAWTALSAAPNRRQRRTPPARWMTRRDPPPARCASRREGRGLPRLRSRTARMSSGRAPGRRRRRVTATMVGGPFTATATALEAVILPGSVSSVSGLRGL